MIRAIKLKLFPTKKKQRIIHNLIIQYRKCVNKYINILFNEGGSLDKITLAKVTQTLLSERYKSNALKQALETYKSCINKKKHTHNKIPVFKGFPTLDAKFIELQEGNNSFDFYIKLSTLRKSKRIVVPSKKTKILNKWIKLGKLIQGCELHTNKIIVWVKIEQEYKTEGKVIGVDIGMRKLLVTSESQFLGNKTLKELRDKLKTKKKNSKSYKGLLKEFHNYINHIINQIDFSEIMVLGHEELTGITTGKRGFRKSKSFRKAQQHWSHRRIITRLIEVCEENRVRPISVNPKDSSCTCIQCKHVAKKNRKGEKFCCIKCGYTLDADLVGAMNILDRTLRYLGSVESPMPKGNINI